MNIVLTLVAALISALIGGLPLIEEVRKFIRILREIFPQTGARPAKSFSARVGELTANLEKASKEVDSVLKEIAEVARNRQATIDALETDLKTLEERQKNLQERIELLGKVPIPVADHLASLLEPGEKRSAQRDYLLFLAGVFVSTVSAILLHLIGLT
jgi:hypothetical protein